jgi:hypothetical protein
MKNFEHDTIIKKTGLLCVGLLFVFFSACASDDDEPVKTEEIVKTTLTISNNSSRRFGSVRGCRQKEREIPHQRERKERNQRV